MAQAELMEGTLPELLVMVEFMAVAVTEVSLVKQASASSGPAPRAAFQALIQGICDMSIFAADLTKWHPAVTTADEEAQFQIVRSIFVKRMTMDTPGKKIQGHAHPYDHVTLLALGTIIMRAAGEETTLSAPILFTTAAGIEHEFECVEPAVMCCIHAIRKGDEETDIADPDLTPAQALELMAKFPLVVVDGG